MKMKKYRVAYIGMGHIHLINLSHDFSRHPNMYELVGVAEIPSQMHNRDMHTKLNKPTDVELEIWDDYKELLAADIDIAVICTDIKDHVEIAEETLGMNIHTVIEKPMACNMADAKRIYKAYKKSTAELIVNWPIAWFPAYNKVKELADSGIVGDILRVQYRSPCTIGPYKFSEHPIEELEKLWWYKHDRGGGSICDYAGYGCVLTTWITGKTAKRVAGMKKNFTMKAFPDIEDYSVFSIDFGDCVGLIEGSWSTMSNGEIKTGPIVYGSKGVIVADRFDPEVKVYTDIIPYVPSPPANQVFPTGGPLEIKDDAAANLYNHLENGTPINEMISADFNMKVMAAFDAGIRSCESGMIENIIEPFED